MAVLVQGQVRDRPWGQTLGALGLRQLTGQLTLHAEDKAYAIAFHEGNVIGAWSPNASDSAPRVALTNHLLSSTQVAPITRRIAALPDRDEIEVVAELARLTPEQVETLRGKLVAQRAARTFSVDSGEFTVDDEITIATIPLPGLDIRSVVYLGTRMNLSEQGLANGIRHFGTYFLLREEAIELLDRFGFSEAERTVLVELRAGTSLHELEAAHRDIDPRMVQSIVYALFACGACEVSDAPAMPRAATVPSVAQPPPAAKKRAQSEPSRNQRPATNEPLVAPEPAPYSFVARTGTRSASQPMPVEPEPAPLGGLTLDLDDDLGDATPPPPGSPGLDLTGLELEEPQSPLAQASGLDRDAGTFSLDDGLELGGSGAGGFELGDLDLGLAGAPADATGARPLDGDEIDFGDAGAPSLPRVDFGPPPPEPERRGPPPVDFRPRPPTDHPLSAEAPHEAFPQRMPTPGLIGPAPPTFRLPPTDTSAPSPRPAPVPTRTQTPLGAPGRSTVGRGTDSNNTPISGRTPYDDDRATGARRAATEHPFPQRTPTPPVTGRAPSDPNKRPISRAAYDDESTPIAGRSPSDHGHPRSPTENPFPMRTPTPPRTTTENPFPVRMPTPPVTGRTPIEQVPGRATTENPFPARSPTPPRAGTENPFPTRSPTPPRTTTDNPFPMRTPTPPVESRTTSGRRPAQGPDEEGVPRNRAASTPPRTVTPAAVDPLNPPTARTGPVVARTSTARKTAALIAARMILLEQNADHFALLGVPFDAPVEAVRTAYLNLVRQLHPDKLAELEVDDSTGNAQRLFAAMGAAFSVLTDQNRRAAYVASLTGGSPDAPRTKTGDEVANTPGIEAFRKGEAALRRDEPHEAIAHFQKAIELSPNDVDFHAFLGWAQFCAATDKAKASNDARKHLERAVARSNKPITARFLLGRMERMLGKDKEALRHFQIVVEEHPNHADARSEIRAIEARLSGNVGKKR